MLFDDVSTIFSNVINTLCVCWEVNFQIKSNNSFYFFLCIILGIADLLELIFD